MEMSPNPFAALTLIVAPAILTNACTVLALGTGNRLARTVDRARALTDALEKRDQSPASPLAAAMSRELSLVERRMFVLIRAMRFFYIGVGSFASAALISLIGAVAASELTATAVKILEITAVLIGAIAVGALVSGAFLLARETRLAVAGMQENVKQAQFKFARQSKEQ